MTTIDLPDDSASLLAVVQTVLSGEVPDAALIGGLAVTARVAKAHLHDSSRNGSKRLFAFGDPLGPGRTDGAHLAGLRLGAAVDDVFGVGSHRSLDSRPYSVEAHDDLEVPGDATSLDPGGVHAR